MKAWAWRRRDETRARELEAYNTAALVAKAMSGKLKKFDVEFPDKPKAMPQEEIDAKRKNFRNFSEHLKRAAEKKKNG